MKTNKLRLVGLLVLIIALVVVVVSSISNGSKNADVSPVYTTEQTTVLGEDLTIPLVKEFVGNVTNVFEGLVYDHDTVGQDGTVYRTINKPDGPVTYTLPLGTEPLGFEDLFANGKRSDFNVNDPANNCSFTDQQSWMDAGLPAECWVEPFTPVSQLGIDFCSPNRCGNYACGCATAQP